MRLMAMIGLSRRPDAVDGDGRVWSTKHEAPRQTEASKAASVGNKLSPPN